MKGQAMPRHAALFAAALAAFSLNFSLNVCAQTASPAPESAAQVPPPGPKTRICRRPVYPREAIRNEWVGVSHIAFLIGVDGQVKDAKVVKSSGHPILDEAAMSALSTCQFKPATQDGKLVEAWHPVQYVWSLD
jgi:TonB family protein